MAAHHATILSQTKKFFERVALQPFQKISCGLFTRKLL
jgi:hypothetical protein